MKSSEPCICGSGKPFGKCCEPFLSYQEKPRNVRQLVRARYAAYALNRPEYREFLIRTWHPATAQRVNIADLGISESEWLGLEILDHQQKGDMGKVEFRARFREKGEEKIHHEKSIFHRLKGNWLYLEGEVNDE